MIYPKTFTPWPPAVHVFKQTVSFLILQLLHFSLTPRVCFPFKYQWSSLISRQKAEPRKLRCDTCQCQPGSKLTLLSHNDVLEAFDQPTSLTRQENRHHCSTGPLTISIICYWCGYYVFTFLPLRPKWNVTVTALQLLLPRGGIEVYTAAGFWQDRLSEGLGVRVAEGGGGGGTWGIIRCFHFCTNKFPTSCKQIMAVSAGKKTARCLSDAGVSATCGNNMSGFPPPVTGKITFIVCLMW